MRRRDRSSAEPRPLPDAAPLPAGVLYGLALLQAGLGAIAAAGVGWLQILELKYFNFHVELAEGQNTKISANIGKLSRYGCISRQELSNEYFFAKFGFDTAENQARKVCPLSAYRSLR